MKFAYRIIVLTAAAMLGSATLSAQSTNQNFPTPVTSTEINGTIKARDMGDARLTSYYFQFDGDQGDLFINIVTRNFTGEETTEPSVIGWMPSAQIYFQDPDGHVWEVAWNPEWAVPE